MTKIDSALTQKADSSQAILKTLYADQWTQSDSIFKQSIQIDGLSPEQNGLISIAQNASAEQLESARYAGFYICEQNENSLCVALSGEKPPCDIPVLLILLG